MRRFLSPYSFCKLVAALLCQGILGLTAASVALAQEKPAPLKFSRIFPSAAQLGTSATITAEGTFPKWPVKVFCDRDDVIVECQSETGKLKVTTSKSAPPGVAWIRVYDELTASALVPLMLTPVDVFVEKEPNADFASASAFPLPAMICGKLAKSGDVDHVRVSLESGETLSAKVFGNKVLNSAMDSVLQITDSTGRVLLHSDDECGVDPQLTFVSPIQQEIQIRLFAFPLTPNSTIGFAGNADFLYAMRLSKGTLVDHFIPLVHGAAKSQALGEGLEGAHTSVTDSRLQGLSPPVIYAKGFPGWQWLGSNDVSNSATFLSDSDGLSESVMLPAYFSGHINSEREVDRFVFKTIAGKKYRATVLSRDFGYPLDSSIKICELATGRLLAENDDVARNQYDASVAFSTKSENVLELQIRDLADSFSPRHAYTIFVREQTASANLTIASDRFVVKRGADVEISISISRLNGFAQKIEIACLDLPLGVQCESVVSEPKGDSAKSIKLKLVASADAEVTQGMFQIRGTLPGSASMDAQNGNELFATYPLRKLVPISTFWLTVDASEEESP